VKDSLRRLMVAGVIAPGEKLPSVRTLAGTLAINPNTIQRAYEALEDEGYLYSVAGRGTFASPHTWVDESRKQALLQQFNQDAAELLFLGVPAQELSARIGTLEGGASK
jgi:GntR family transcriptional regulator